MRNIWEQHKKWLTVLLALIAIALVVIITQAAAPTPKTVAEPPAETEITFDMDKNRVYSVSDGVVVIPASFVPEADDTEIVPVAAAIGDTSEAALLAAPVPNGNYTLPEQAQMSDGSIGVLTIPKLSLSVNVFETGDEMEAMTKGLAHFKTTSAWSGNIGLAGHNVNPNLTDGFFKDIHTLKEGDVLTYKTALGTRSYAVTTIKEIAASDWSYLGRMEENKLTLITCITGKPNSRLVVQASEKTA